MLRFSSFIKLRAAGWLLAKSLFSVTGRSEEVSRVPDVYVLEGLHSQSSLSTEVLCTANGLLLSYL
jgi:hypothetical protein